MDPKIIRFAVCVFISAFFFSADLLAQYGYYYAGTYAFPDTNIYMSAVDLPISPSKEDVKAIGMGKAQTALGSNFNAMMYNPALLSRSRFTFDLLGLQAVFTKKTLDAARFVIKNRSQFTEEGGDSYRLIREGFEEYINGADNLAKLEGLKKISRGLEFPTQLKSKVIGTQEEPQIHGAKVVPDLQIQFGNWGFSLFSNIQTGFQVFPGHLYEELTKLNIPQNATDLTEQEVLILSGIVNTLFDEQGNFQYNTAFPRAMAVSYVDIVGALGYAFDLGNGLSLGANLKLINRRLSARQMEIQNYDNAAELLDQTVSDLEKSTWGFTMDVGGIYRMKDINTDLAVSILNLIPVQKISTNMKLNFLETGLIYGTDAFGNPIVNANGDTAIYAASQNVMINLPVDMKVPILFNTGISHRIGREVTLAFDWVDMFAQDDKFIRYAERFRLGAEYKFGKNSDMFGFAVRAGLADLKPAFGLGLNLLRVLSIDAAYAYENYIEQNSFYLQFRLGW